MLEVKDISFRYGTGPVLLKHITFSVSSEERLYLCAPSGFGKTTLCKVIAGYEKQCGGSVFLDGLPVPQRGVCPIQLIGQHPENMLDPRMRLQNSLEEAGELDSEIIRALGIEQDWMRRYPHELSGGQLQRFCIARALISNPRYLVADEISTMLDAVTQVSIWKTLIAFAEERNMGIIFTSHSSALAEKIATRKLLLEKL